MARTNALLVGATVVLIAAVCASAAAATGVNLGRSLLQTTEFPPLCQCDRDNKHSPWRLTQSQPVKDGKYVKQCFKIADVGGCDKTQKCCNGQGVEKVEFDVVDGCKDSLKRVTVNGALKSFEYNTGLNVLRITNLGLTAATAPGTEICLLVEPDSPCAATNGICGTSGICKYAIFNADRDCCPVSLTGANPPPPFTPAIGRNPPPPPSAFPWCKCERNPALSQLTTVLGDVSSAGNLTKICFKVETKDACPIGSPCCQFSLYKLEIDANPACKDALVYSTLDGVKRARFFQTNPYPVIKVSQINKAFSSVAGTEVCLFLRGGSCSSPAKLCTGADGKCNVALFNKPGSSPSCCPLSLV